MTTSRATSHRQPTTDELVLWLSGEADVELSAMIEAAMETDSQCLNQVLSLAQTISNIEAARKDAAIVNTQATVQLSASTNSPLTWRVMMSLCASLCIIAGMWYAIQQRSNDELSAWVVCLDNANNDASRAANDVMTDESTASEFISESKSDEAFSWILLAVNEASAPQGTEK